MFQKIINWTDDKLNPILVKELRQSTNSRILTVLVIAFLAIQLFSMYIQIFMNDSTSFDSKQMIFPTVLAILIASCIYGIIPTIGNRFYKERNGDSIDLIYTTVLSPFAVIAGKMFSAMGLIILLYSLCAPFIFISYLFPGIDILTIFWSLWYSFLGVVAIAQLMILVATIKTSKIMRSIIMLIYFILITMFSFSGAVSLMNPFGRSSFSHTTFYFHLFFILFWLLAVGFLYVLSACAVSSAHANRALWPRLYAAGFWFIGLLFIVGSYFFAPRHVAKDISEVWLVISTIVFIAFMGVASGERAKFGNRLRKYIPRNRLLRFVAFPFFSGEVNGIIYSVLFLALTVVTFYFLPYKTTSMDRGITVIVGSAGYFTWYCLLALQIKRMFIHKYPNLNSFLFMLFAVIIFTLVPLMIAWGVHHSMDLPDKKVAPFLVLSFGIMLMRGYATVGLICGWALSGITLIILLPFFRKRISEFKPLEKPVMVSEDAENNE